MLAFAAKQARQPAPKAAHDRVGHEPLATAVAKYGARFGWDFGSVPIFSNDCSGSADRAGSGIASTTHAAIHLGPQFGGLTGPLQQRVIAHELAHVVQQSGGTRGLRNESVHSPHVEAEARAAAAAAVAGTAIPALSPVAADLTLGWDSFEHVAIGDANQPPGRYIVLDAQRKDLPNFARPPAEWSKPWQTLFNDRTTTADQKRAMQYGLTYGEVLALAGDFYGGQGPSASTEAIWAFKRLNAAPFTEIIKLVPLIRSHAATTGALETATGGRFLTLAKRNLSHFSRAGVDAQGNARNNIAVWREGHIQALIAAQNGDRDTAWAMNAVADHFLTDAFSAGHTRQDREKLLDHPVQAKVIHDLDNEYGVAVSNKRGDRWIAYGDDFWKSTDSAKDAANARNRELTFAAEKASQSDVAQALADGSNYRIPATFSAEAIVPTPIDPNQARWGTWAKIKEYASLAVSELPGMIAATWTDDDDVRAWVASNGADAIARAPVDERLRMVGTLLAGVVTNSDVQAIEKILSQSTDLDAFRRRFDKAAHGLGNFGHRTRVIIAMGFRN